MKKKAPAKSPVSTAITTVTSHEEFSNIITPPDFVDYKGRVVVMIDPEWTEVEDVAFYLKTSKHQYNVYVYRDEMGDQEWLNQAVAKTTHIIVNTVGNDTSPLKDKIASRKESFYYGPKNFLMNENKIDRPIDYFLKLEQ
jgi:hypothetical protein